MIVGVVDVLDIEPVPPSHQASAPRYRVTLEDDSGLHTVDVDRADLRSLGLMEAFITGAPLLLACGLLGTPLVA